MSTSVPPEKKPLKKNGVGKMLTLSLLREMAMLASKRDGLRMSAMLEPWALKTPVSKNPDKTNHEVS